MARRSSTPEREKSIIKPVVGIGAVLATTVYFGAEPVAKHFNPPPSAPERVVKQEPREPISLAIAIDRTPSAISKELPTVKAATRDFLEKGGVLKPGDRVSIFTFAEDAAGETFPATGSQVLDGIDSVQTERRRGIKTFVVNSLATVLERVHGQPNPVVAAWSDFKDECAAGGNCVTISPSDTAGIPIRFIIPDGSYAADAGAVKDAVPSQDLKIVKATNGQEFGNALAGFVKNLTDQATAKAEAKAEQEADAKFAEEKKDFTARTQAYHEKIRSLKNSFVHIPLAILAALAGALVGYDIRERSKPRLKGVIVDKRSTFSQSFPIPKRTEALNLNRMIGENIILIPSKQGIVCRIQGIPEFILKDGDQIIPNVFYYQIDPGL